MAPVALKVSPQALADIRAADAWWRANRPAAPRMLRAELREAFRMLVEQPRAGMAAADIEAQGIRRLFLRGTRYFLYYSAFKDTVEVLRLWHASRGKKPKL